MFRDIVSAEVALYGSYSGNLHIQRLPRSGEDDLAAAWIRGDREIVMKYVEAHEAEVRSRPVIVKRVPKKLEIVRLRKLGWKTREIATQLDVSPRHVARVCRQSGLKKAERRRIDPTKLAALRAQGLTVTTIAARMGISRKTVWRATR